jgi:hypothetical protein
MTAEATALLHKQRRVLWTPRQYKTSYEFIRTVEGVWPNYPFSIELEFQVEEMEVRAQGPPSASR